MAEYVNSESILEVDFLNSIIVDTNNTIIFMLYIKIIYYQKYEGWNQLCRYRISEGRTRLEPLSRRRVKIKIWNVSRVAII